MLGDNKSAVQALLSGAPKTSTQPKASASAAPETESKLDINNEKIENRQSTSSKKKKNNNDDDKDDAQFTTILKFLNFFIGLGVIAFGVSCYKFFKQDTQNLDLVGIILPGYIAFSGLIIILIECNIKIINRNMKFLYNFIGRGLFNIYVGVMPLSLIRLNANQDQTFQIVIYIIVSLMCLVGALYIIAKIFCCAKEENKRKKKRNNSDQDNED